MDTAVIYCRISSDSEGKGEGVARQEKDCRRLAAERGLTVAAVFVENDTSASAHSSKPRAQYAEMLRRAGDGEWSAIIAWKQDRLTRRIEEAAEIGAVIAQRKHSGNPLRLLTVKSGDYEDTAVGKGLYGIQSVLNAMEADQISERTQAAARDRAERGRAHGRMTYGFRREHGVDVVDADQAAVLREAADRALRGESLRAVAKDLTARRVPPPGYLVELRRHARLAETAAATDAPAPEAPTLGPWTGSRLRQLLERPANAGLRTHHGEIVHRGGAALWPEARQEQLWALFRDPERRTSRSTELQFMLSGFLRCGKCGAACRTDAGRTYTRKRPDKTTGECVTVRRADAYACPACRGTRALLPDVERAVTMLALSRLASADGPILATKDRGRAKELAAELEGHRAKLSNLVDDYTDGFIDRHQMRRGTAKVRKAIEAAERDLKALTPSPALGAFVDGNEDRIADAWDAAPVTVRRELLRALFERLELRPVGKGTRWNPKQPGDRLAWVWSGKAAESESA